MLARKNILFGLLVALLMVALLSGCGAKSQEGAKSAAKEQVIRYNVGAEPKTLDPAKATGLPEGTIMMQLFEGLTRYDAKQEIKPGIAESWEISKDGLTYTFKLRDAKWSNGDPVTAKDFVYSWLRALDPKTASEYAYQLFYIKGAEEYNSGKGKKEDVALKALDDKTLQVTLKAPAPQFLGLTAFQTLYPVHQKTVEGNPNWFADPAKYVSNGPFKMVSWDHNQKIVVEKNPNYWDAGNVKLSKLEIYLIDSIDTAYNMFKTGQLDFQDDVPVQELAALKGSKELKIVPDASVYFYRFNVTRKPFNDVRVRKALAMAIDRKTLVEQVTQAGQKPAFAFVPFGFKDADGKDFRENAGDFFKEDVEQARKLLAEAGYPDGKGFPKVTIMYNTNENHQKIAQAIQQMWKKNLNIEVGLQNVEWQVKLDRETKLDYDIARAGWSPDYMDPMSFIDMFVTGGGNNQTGWSNPEYDKLVRQANSSGDQKVRMEAMHKAEKLLMDEMPVMPIYFYTNPNLIKENIKGVIIPPFGTYADFKWAYVE
ncbi:peptide ABC transporter substrate-binding protein [Desulfurispora thermophila]|uniref:peptide ABC transporter substrate-binding protein n=1 Tax=Desulfurispora thermophila TaxID=265470 RepID=UPI0003625049|nr:peptide ABC transporter substrate-binding protein [Desulfurispora thermophila]